jgi:phosphoribosylanthranilate isomerase
VIVQIYTAQSPAEARALAELGVDHVGVTPSRRGLPGEVSDETAAEIVEELRGLQKRQGLRGTGARETRPRAVALTVDQEIAPISAMASAVRPDILHFCPPAGSIGPELIEEFRHRHPEIQVMYAVTVEPPPSNGAAALAEVERFQDLADWFILDTQAPNIPGVGASGALHDWSVSRRIVEESPVPVILAGGLSPENVAAAVREVAPAGVDSLTHTNRVLPDGGFAKDLDLVAAFVQEAGSAVRKR